jgi:hypothetical protein
MVTVHHVRMHSDALYLFSEKLRPTLPWQTNIIFTDTSLAPYCGVLKSVAETRKGREEIRRTSTIERRIKR